MRTGYRIIVLMLLCVALAGCTQIKRFFIDAPLRYDGIYQADKRGEGEYMYWPYLRFFPDGTVISASSIGEPHHLKRWFNKDSENSSRGEVVLQDMQISFTTTSQYGQVDYSGEIHADEIQLQSHSHINGNRSQYTFRFINW